MKQRANWTTVIVTNRLLQNERGAVRSSDDAVCPAFAAPPVTYVVALKEDQTKSLEQQNQHRADLQFSLGVAIVFALPVFIALSFYVTAVLFT
jgi:hypothetical protein